MIDALTVAEGAAGISLGVGLIRRVMAEKETEEPTQAAATTSPVTGDKGVRLPPSPSEVRSWYDSGNRLAIGDEVANVVPAVRDTPEAADSADCPDVQQKVSEPAKVGDVLAPDFVQPLPPSGFAWAEDIDGQRPAPVVEARTSVAVAPSSELPPIVSQEQGATLRSPEEWPRLGGSGAWHPMRGPWPKTAAREQWVPPAGWKPPTKPVLSWYDRGARLVPLSSGASSSAATPVTSWYDKGIRLPASPSAAPSSPTSDEPRIIQATKPTAVVAKAAASSSMPFTSQKAQPRVPVSELWSPASSAPSARDEAAVSNSKDSPTPKRILFTRVLTVAAVVAIAARLAGMPVRLLP